jgi:alkylhydroperoxidase family enzyme
MSRIPTHTIGDAPDASKPLLDAGVHLSPTGNPLRLHAQMAHSPAVLAGYSALRRATAEHGTLGRPVSAALIVATAVAVGNDYAVAITSRLAHAGGWTEEQIGSLRAGTPTGDAKLDALAAVVAEAANGRGQVDGTTWKAAQAAGWNDEQLAEAFACFGLTIFTAYFLNYAETELDLPAGPAAA